MVEILMTPLDVGPRAVDEALSLLSGDERARVSRFADTRDRRRFAVARAALRRQLGRRLQVPPGTIEFAYGPRGKPRLAGPEGGPDLSFSLSHSEGVAALAIATGSVGEVGVDIETLRAVPDAQPIAAWLCSPAEWREYQGLTGTQKLRGFFRWWTCKEALVKAQGGGLCQPLDAFHVRPEPGGPWTVREFAPGPDLVGAVAFAATSLLEECLVVHSEGPVDGA